MLMSITGSSAAMVALAAALVLPGLAEGSVGDADSANVNWATLDEVVVTATKRGAQSLSDVPIAVSVFNGAELERTGASSLSEYLQKAPGVGIIETQPGANAIQIRGISSQAGDATVGFYLDDLPFIMPGSGVTPDVRSYDLDRVEVLRGPQGTLYGAGSEGGTVRILTRNPDLEAFEAKGSVTQSTTDGGGPNRQVAGAVSLPVVSGKFAVRAVASYDSLAGWIDDPVSGARNLNGSRIGNYRLKSLLKPADNLSITSTAWATRIWNGSPNAADINGQRPLVGNTERAQYDNDLYNTAIQYDLPNLTLFDAASYMRGDSDTHPVLPVNAHTVIGSRTWTDEFRVTSRLSGPVNFLAGIFYADSKEDVYLDVFLPAALPYQRDRWHTKQYSVFGELYYVPTGSRAEFTFGARYFHDDRTILDNVPTQVALFDLLGLPNPREATFHSADPRFNFAYHFSDHFLGYVSAVKGFRSGGLQPGISLLSAALVGALDRVPAAASPESLWTYELGSKLVSLMGGTLDVESAVYFTDWKDIIVVLPLSGRPIAYALNGPRAHSYGIDLNVLLRPLRGLTLSVGGNANKAVFVDSFGIFHSGQPIDNVPNATFQATVDYTRAVTGAVSAFAHIEAQYNALRRSQSFVTGPPVIVTDTESTPLTMTNARVGLQTGRWTAALFVDNLFNVRGAITPYEATVTPVAASGFAALPRPRTVGVNVSAHY